MAKINTGAFAVAAIIAFSVAIILPAVFGEPASFTDRSGGDPWWNFAYNFQTLITGVIAVVAAYLTVRQMRLTDEEANRRHDQLVKLGQTTDENADVRHNQLIKLSLRSDRLRIERLLYPQFGELRANHRTLRKLQWTGLNEHTSMEKWRAELVILTAYQYNEILLALSAIREILDRPAVKEAESLFGGILRRDFDEARNKSLDLLIFMDDHASYAAMVRDYGPKLEIDGSDHDQKRRDAEEELLKTRGYISELLERLDGIFQGLYKLSDFYEIPQ